MSSLCFVRTHHSTWQIIPHGSLSDKVYDLPESSPFTYKAKNTHRQPLVGFEQLRNYLVSRFRFLNLQDIFIMKTLGFPTANCTLETCSLLEEQIEYQPNLGGNCLYIAIFVSALSGQLYLGNRYCSWGFLVWMFCGLVLEIVSCIARLQMQYHLFANGPFIMYEHLPPRSLLSQRLTQYLQVFYNLEDGFHILHGFNLPRPRRLIVVLGRGLSRFKPRT